MPHLKPDDYENILKFASFINKDFDNYIPNILFAMDEFFGYSLSVYMIFNRDKNGKAYVENTYSARVNPEGLQQYRNSYYKGDLFFLRIDYRKNSDVPQYVNTTTDVATYEEFFATDYGKYLKRIGTPYQAVLRGAYATGIPLHVLNVYKTQEQGDFTFYEKNLLNQVGKAYSDSVELYKQHLANTSYAHFLSHYTENQDLSMAVINEQKNVIYHNECFLRTACALFETESLPQTTRSLLTWFTGQLGKPPDKMIEPMSIPLQEFSVTIDPQRVKSGETLTKFYVITIRKTPPPTNKPAASSWKRIITDEYNFTLREQEVIDLLIEGQDNAQIAANLCINLSTVKFHIKNIFRKLGVSNRTAAIAKLFD